MTILKTLKKTTSIAITGLILFSSTQTFAQQEAIDALNQDKNNTEQTQAKYQAKISNQTNKAGILYDKYTKSSKKEKKPVLNARSKQHIYYGAIEAGRTYDRYTHSYEYNKGKKPNSRPTSN